MLADSNKLFFVNGTRQILLLVILSTASLITQANATPEEEGLRIAQEVDRRDSGFVDHTASM